jgi:hypothetical protein
MIVLTGFKQNIPFKNNAFDHLTFEPFRIEYYVREIRDAL